MSTKAGIFNVRTIFLEEEALRVLKGNFPSLSLKLSKRNVCLFHKSSRKKEKEKKQFIKGISLSHFSDCIGMLEFQVFYFVDDEKRFFYLP